jgi:UTP--glucose-1-phosphate uridylyltransferase
MLPFSLAVPKELAPLGSKPAIDFVLDEAASAGLEEAIVVVAPGKELLRRHLELAQAGGSWPSLRLRWVEQAEPTGLADAILLCSPLLGDQPFAVLLPDNLPLSPDYRLDALLEPWRQHGRHVVGVVEIDRRWSGLFGNSGRIDSRPLAAGVLAIDRLHDRAPGRLVIDGPSGETVSRACGRYVFGAVVLEALAASRRAVAGELDKIATVQRLAREGNLLGALLPMPLFDVGYPAGLLAASAYLAERRQPS